MYIFERCVSIPSSKVLCGFDVLASAVCTARGKVLISDWLVKHLACDAALRHAP